MSLEADAIVKFDEEPEWFSRIDFDDFETLAAIGYTPEKIAMYFRIPHKEFMWYFNLVGSPLKWHYERGQLVQQAKEGLAMAAAAEKGDNVTQAQRFDKLRKAVGYRNSISKIFYDDIG